MPIRARILLVSLLSAALAAWALAGHAPTTARAYGTASITPYFVQHVTDVSLANPNTAVIDIAVPAGVYANDTLVVSVVSNFTAAGSVQDSADNVYTRDAGFDPAAVVHSSLFYCLAPRALDGDRGDSLTLSYPSIPGVPAGRNDLAILVSVDEYSGVEAIDVVNSTTPLTPNDSATLGLTPSTSPELFVGVVGALGGGSGNLDSPGSAWGTNANVSLASEHMQSVRRVLGSASTATLTGSVNTTALWSLSAATMYADGETSASSAATVTVGKGKCPGGTPTAIHHVVVIIEENRSAAQIMPVAGAANIKNLAKQCGYVHHYAAATHPSLPNYLALIGGVDPTKGDCNPLSASSKVCSPTGYLPITSSDLFGVAPRAKTYAGNMKSAGTLTNCTANDWDESTSPTYTYAAHHNPQLYFQDVGITASSGGHTSACNNNDVALDDRDPANPDGTAHGTTANYTLFSNAGCTATGVSATSPEPTGCLPEFTFIVLDNEQNMHDGTVKTSDTQIGLLVDALTLNDSYKDGNTLIVLTWDEGQKITNPDQNSAGYKKAVVAQDHTCYDSDSSVPGEFNQPGGQGPEIFDNTDLPTPSSSTAGVYSDASLLPQSCMVSLIVMNHNLTSDTASCDASRNCVGKFGTAGSSGASSTAYNHFDLLYSILTVLGKSGSTISGFPALASGGDDTWTSSTHCSSACHAPRDIFTYFGF